MKKYLALCTLIACSTFASAESSVTLFGIADVGVRDVKNGSHSETFVESGGMSPSRLGLTGNIDIAQDSAASFWLETGYGPSNGASADTTRFFNRRSTVSLTSKSYGELRIGRDFTPSYIGYEDYDEFGDTGVAYSDKFDSSLGTARQTAIRADNQVAYFTPSSLGGVYGRLSVAPGQGVIGAKYVGGLIGYMAGAAKVSVAYAQTTVGKVGGTDLFKTYDVGASYDFQVAQIEGYYTDSKFSALERENFSVGASVPIGSTLLRAQITHSTASGTSGAVNTNGNAANQYAIGAVYNFNKTAALYATAAEVRNKGAAVFSVATTSVMPTAGGWESKGFEAGVRLKF